MTKFSCHNLIGHCCNIKRVRASLIPFCLVSGSEQNRAAPISKPFVEVDKGTSAANYIFKQCMTIDIDHSLYFVLFSTNDSQHWQHRSQSREYIRHS